VGCGVKGIVIYNNKNKYNKNNNYNKSAQSAMKRKSSIDLDAFREKLRLKDNAGNAGNAECRNSVNDVD